MRKYLKALVVKLVDTKDLKSLPFWSASSVWPRAPLMVNPFIVFDKNSKSLKIKNKILKRIKLNS